MGNVHREQPVESVTCPECGSPMKYRQGKWGAFYGCTKFPWCKKTIKASQINAAILKEPKP